MVYNNFRSTDANLSIGSLCRSVVLLSDLENMRISVGISLISCVQAAIYVILYLLPVTSSSKTPQAITTVPYNV